MQIHCPDVFEWYKINPEINVTWLNKCETCRLSLDEQQGHGGQLTCGRYTCVGGSVAQLALAAASAALASADNETGREELMSLR